MTIKRLLLPAALFAAGILMCGGAALAVEAAAKSAVNVRTGPGKAYGIVDQLTAGEIVDISECAPTNFCFVNHDGPDGWVSADYLIPVSDDEADDEGMEEGSGDNPDCSFGFNVGPGGPSLSVNCGDAPPPPPPPPPEEEPSACFYTGNSFAGDDLCVGLGTKNTLNTTFNNKISSVQLFGGAKAKLCEDPGLEGACKIVTGDTELLPPSINNKASSLTVYVGAPPLPEPPEPDPSDGPETYSTGGIDLKQTFTADLDDGTTGGGGSDIWYEAVTNVEKYITPKAGAMIALGDGSNRGYDGCSEELFSTERVPLEDVPPGTYVCVKTDEGRISQFRVNGFVGTTMKIGYTTWSD